MPGGGGHETTSIEKIYPEETQTFDTGKNNGLNTYTDSVDKVPNPYGSGREVVSFLVFVILFVIVTVYNHTGLDAYYYSNGIRQAVVMTSFMKSDGTTASFETIRTTSDVWLWLHGPLVQSLYPSQTSTAPNTIALANTRIGGLRLRQVRVMPNSCQVQEEYTKLISYCYGSLSSTTESTIGFGPIQNSLNVSRTAAYSFAKTYFGTSPTYNDLMQCIQSCSLSVGSIYGLDKSRYAIEFNNECSLSCTCFYSGSSCVAPAASIPAPLYTYNWSPSVESSISGLFTSIPGSGFIVDLPLNTTSASSALHQLEMNSFLDVATRALVIEFVVFNPYLQLFDMVQLVIEFPPTGGITTRATSTVLDIYAYSPQAGGKVFFESSLVLCVVLYAGEILYKMHRRPISEYLTSGWNKLHVINIGLFLAVITLRLAAINKMYGTSAVNIVSAPPTQLFLYFTTLADWFAKERAINAVNAILIWFGLLKYTQISRRMYMLVRVISHASNDLICCIVLVFICLLGYAQAGFLAFSTVSSSFRTFGQSFLTVFQAMTFHFDSIDLSNSYPLFVFFYFITFYINIVMICLNIFIGILNNSFQTIEKENFLLTFPFSNGIIKTFIYWFKYQWISVKFGKTTAMKLDSGIKKIKNNSFHKEITNTTQLHPYMAMEMQKLSEKLTNMLQVHDEKRNKLENIENMLRSIEDTCMELKTDKDKANISTAT